MGLLSMFADGRHRLWVMMVGGRRLWAAGVGAVFTCRPCKWW